MVQQSLQGNSTFNINNIEHETLAISSQISKLLEEFSDVFDIPQSLPSPRQHDNCIPHKPDAHPLKLKPYRYPHSQKNEIENQVTEMLNNGIIQHSTNPFASPVLLVKIRNIIHGDFVLITEN
ncbi:hypothetical protein ACH5RR_041363 [Cinchona calisaya]|uniref:Uncharacterized protein n=1 Tax=Cinchona calisaya TaxID=153742 RepID=A0ABD2XV79_9GENT